MPMHITKKARRIDCGFLYSYFTIKRAINQSAKNFGPALAGSAGPIPPPLQWKHWSDLLCCYMIVQQVIS